MPSIATLLWLLIKYGPTVVRIIRQIIALIESIRNEDGGRAVSDAYERRLNATVSFMEDAPTSRRAEARARLHNLRHEILNDRIGRSRP